MAVHQSYEPTFFFNFEKYVYWASCRIDQRENIAVQIFESCKSDYEGPAPYFSSIKDKCLVKLDENNIQNQF
jgi:hypothetical protein